MGKVLVLGASGLFGSHAALAFHAAGWQVHRFQRGTDMRAAAMGMDVIVNALNPPLYHDWAGQIPVITEQVIAAGLASGARMIVPGNVYVYGDTPGVWGAQTPHRPNSRKGKIRAEMERRYRKAAEQGLRVLILRGGDFISPGAEGSMFGVMMKGLARGRITIGGPSDLRHAYAPVDDMTRAAVALVARALPDFADIPFPGLAFSADQLRAEVERQTERPYRFTRFPWWLMRLTSPLWELARELLEMRYLNEVAHELDPTTFAKLLPDFQGASLADVVAAELAMLGLVKPRSHGGAISTQTG